ncbi:MAG: ATP-binding protein [Thermodesulfobacteriota bacterium]
MTKIVKVEEISMAEKRENTSLPSPDQDVIGKASATERDPNSSEKFSFWLSSDKIVNPFDIVEAEQLENTITYGLVTNIKQITDAPSHLSNYISSDFGSIEADPQTPRQGANVAEVSVLANNDPADPKRYPMGIYMPVQSDAAVRFADAAGIHVALGIDKMFEYERESGEKITIPAGMIRMSNGARVPVYLDRRFVLGPEGAHVNIAGISGLATKTSYAMFLIQSILQKVGMEDIAVILLNVKQNDLLVIDQKRQLKPEEYDTWEALGLEPRPFENVRYLLPWGDRTQTTGLPNIYGDLPDAFQTYAYSLEDVIGDRYQPGPGLDLLVRVPDPWDTLGALIGEINQGLINNEPRWRNVRTWDDLLNGPPLMDQGVPKQVGEVRASSVGRFVRVLRRVVRNRQSGIFVPQRPERRAANLGQEIRDIRPGQTLVVDIAKLTDEERALVFGHIIQEVYSLYAEATIDERRNIPRNMIIFVDELNKYAPGRKGEGETSILQYVLDIAARGRSLHVILISAEQFMSEVHGQVVGNCATKVIGRSDSSELSDSAYRFIAQDVKAHLTRLDKGDLLLSHPIYRQPVKIEFPKPAYRAIGHERRQG